MMSETPVLRGRSASWPQSDLAPSGTAASAPLGDPMEAWRARGRELNAIYTALSPVVRETIGRRSEGGRYTGDPVEDIKALGEEIKQLRAERAAVIDVVNIYGDEILHGQLTLAGLLLPPAAAPGQNEEGTTDAR